MKPFVFSLRGVYLQMFFDRRKEVDGQHRDPHEVGEVGLVAVWPEIYRDSFGGLAP